MSTKVVIMSDSHGRLNEQLLEDIENADAVIHAGDFDNNYIYQEILKMSRIYAVRGNCDYGMWAQGFRESLQFRIEDLNFYMRHIPSDILYVPEGIDVVIFGHTHTVCDRVEDGIRYINPGSCSRGRNNQGDHYMVAVIDGKNMDVEVKNC